MNMQAQTTAVVSAQAITCHPVKGYWWWFFSGFMPGG
jgi:hypothetical protein